MSRVRGEKTKSIFRVFVNFAKIKRVSTQGIKSLNKY